MGREILRGAVIERERVDRKSCNAPFFQQPLCRLWVNAGKMHHAARIPADKFRMGDLLRPSRMHRDAAAVRQPVVLGFPGDQILLAHGVVRISRGVRRHVHHRERNDQLLRRDHVDGSARIGIMKWRIDVRAGVLEHVPPIHVRAILAERVLLLDRDSRRAEECRKVGRKGMRQVDHGREASLCPRGRRADRGEACGRNSCMLEESAARHGAAHRLPASGNAHDDLLLSRWTQDRRGACCAQ